MNASYRLLASLFLLTLAAAALAQGRESAPLKSSPVITAAASRDKVRFSSPATMCQIRVQILAAGDAPLFDSAWKDGNVFDWPVDSPGQSLVSGSYRCVVMVKDLDGQVTQRETTLTARGGQVTIDSRTADDAIASVNPDAAGPKITVLAHDETNGAIANAGGDLIFRFGNYLAGKDSEKMRLTSGGKLGIGVDSPQATLDVNGLVRTSRGILFPDGTVLTSIDGQLTTQPNRDEAAGRPDKPGATPRTIVASRPAILPGGDRLIARPSTTTTPRFLTTDVGVGVWNASPAFPLDVGGDINTSGVYRLTGVPILKGDYQSTIVGFGAGPSGSPVGVYSSNVFVGQQTGANTIYGAANTFIGDHAGQSNNGTGGGSIHAGGDNTFLGAYAGQTPTIEHDNTAVGYDADMTAGVINSSAIGSYAQASQSNTVILGSISGVHYATATTSTGIATQTPNQYLGVGGGITVDANSTNNGTLLANSVIAFGVAAGNGISGEAISSQRTGSGNLYGLDFYTYYTKRMSITQNGNVGIGTATPGATLEVVGTALADAYNIRSSARFKDNIQTIDSALEKAERLRGVSFDYKDSGAHSLGFVAEEVAAVVPEAVQRDAAGEVVGLDYNRITPLLVEALKAQEKLIAKLQESNRALEDRIRRLEAAQHAAAGTK